MSPPREESESAPDTGPTSPEEHSPTAEPTAAEASSDATSVDALDRHLPAATVDSRWWYWIAAVPIYFVVSLALVALLFGVVVLGLFFDAAGGVALLFVLFALVGILPGLVLTVVFPLAMYIDARAVGRADLDWEPDPVLYGLVALAGVLMTAFTVSVPLALYYLYQRHRYVGTP